MTSPSELTIEGPRSLRGRVRVPGDKSISHRALLLAAVAEGRSALRGLGTGDDVVRTRSAVDALGVRTKLARSGELRIQGTGWSGLREPLDVVDCGNSGTALRLLLGVVAGCSFHTVVTGDSSVARRPMLRAVEPLRRMGARIDGRDGGDRTPLAIRGGGLSGRRHDLPVASAQVKTAVLLAGLQADGRTEVAEPAPSRDHTERMLRSAGVALEERDGVLSVERGVVGPLDLDVPGDPSSAAFFAVGALVSPDSEVTIEQVSLNPRRIAYLDVLRRMGADVSVRSTGEVCGEPVGEIEVRTSELRGTVIAGDEVPSVIDEIPALAVAAAFAEGTTEVRDAEELRVKETDRIGAIEQELSQMGVEVEARRDGFVVHGGRPVPARFKSHGDHRIAMASAVAGLACEGRSRVAGWRAVASSYPEFAEHLEALSGPLPGSS